MTGNLQKLKGLWTEENISSLRLATNKEVNLFQAENNLIIPQDLLEYFLSLNGTNEQYDKNFCQFYSFDHFKSINDELKNWSGSPDYSNIINTLKDYEDYFPFADYHCHFLSYVIRLHKDKTAENEIIVVCGDAYKHIANSFSEFIDLYLKDADQLQF